jgi:DNA-binding NtrC family response regulator
MPGINGVVTLKRIREIDPDVPVYIVTAFHKEFLEQLQEVKEENLKFQLLRKPIGNDEIIEVTTMALSE